MLFMLAGNRIVVVMPAYNAEKTLERVYLEIPKDVVDEILLVDDSSQDRTVEIARRLGIRTLVHEENRGYGANQKTCYREALSMQADIIVMLHPDHQYEPRVIPFAAGFIVTDICDVILGCRIRTRRETLQGGMPLYKYAGNRFLTLCENLAFGQNMGDFHSGFRLYRRAVLERIDFSRNSDDFVFDSQLLAQAIFCGFRIGDVPMPTWYASDASSIAFWRGFRYGVGTLGVIARFLIEKAGIRHDKLFKEVSG